MTKNLLKYKKPHFVWSKPKTNWSLSITVSTTGFHPVNAGSTPAEITKKIPELRFWDFLGIFDGSEP